MKALTVVILHHLLSWGLHKEKNNLVHWLIYFRSVDKIKIRQIYLKYQDFLVLCVMSASIYQVHALHSITAVKALVT